MDFRGTKGYCDYGSTEIRSLAIGEEKIKLLKEEGSFRTFEHQNIDKSKIRFFEKQGINGISSMGRLPYLELDGTENINNVSCNFKSVYLERFEENRVDVFPYISTNQFVFCGLFGYFEKRRFEILLERSEVNLRAYDSFLTLVLKKCSVNIELTECYIDVLEIIEPISKEKDGESFTKKSFGIYNTFVKRLVVIGGKIHHLEK